MGRTWNRPKSQSGHSGKKTSCLCWESHPGRPARSWLSC